MAIGVPMKAQAQGGDRPAQASPTSQDRTPQKIEERSYPLSQLGSRIADPDLRKLATQYAADFEAYSRKIATLVAASEYAGADKAELEKANDARELLAEMEKKAPIVYDIEVIETLATPGRPDWLVDSWRRNDTISEKSRPALPEDVTPEEIHKLLPEILISRLGDKPGLTRDRLEEEASRGNYRFEKVDGGPDEAAIDAYLASQQRQLKNWESRISKPGMAAIAARVMSQYNRELNQHPDYTLNPDAYRAGLLARLSWAEMNREWDRPWTGIGLNWAVVTIALDAQSMNVGAKYSEEPILKLRFVRVTGLEALFSKVRSVLGVDGIREALRVEPGLSDRGADDAATWTLAQKAKLIDYVRRHASDSALAKCAGMEALRLACNTALAQEFTIPLMSVDRMLDGMALAGVLAPRGTPDYTKQESHIRSINGKVFDFAIYCASDRRYISDKQDNDQRKDLAKIQAEAKQAQAEAKQAQAELRAQTASTEQAEAEAKQAQAEAKQAQAEAKQAEAEAKQAQAELLVQTAKTSPVIA